ncbi:Urea ABC transporter, permease protein UrtC [Hyphomicrobium sulfonivorans]|uniref:Urea ABC transporter, permease protein UrtC n=1 Tax=Hyphomicrobium sulfonivorans TaxID=121290 RepID=A0A109BBC2_HYPSL|nr:urea ABC transporter permease subunit UrtC [Hyphomicrobium sulfonivorans]KWT65499.1 Urea ABC transporter, permease protein UrtC [Hyphomicrobium sulfonivorans]
MNAKTSAKGVGTNSETTMGNPYHNKTAQWIAYALFFLALAAIPFSVDDDFLLNQLATYGVYGMLALSISLCWGFGGILNLGQGIAFGLGAYGMAMTMQMQTQTAENPIPPIMLNNGLDYLPFLWWPFQNTVSGLIFAVGIPTLFCAVFGRIMFKARVSGAFFAIMTLAMLSAFYTIILDQQAYTGGVNGITPPSPLQLGSLQIDPYSPAAYWTVFFALLIATVIAKLITQSSFGLVTQAIRDDAERVRFLGYSVSSYETTIYTISGLIAAVAGCLWVMVVQYVSPAQLDVGLSISMVIWAAIGGRMSLLWAIIGAFLIQGGQSYLGDAFLSTWLLILGGFFIIVVRFLPNGLASLVEAGLGMLARKPKETSFREPSGVKPVPSE